MVLSVGVRCCVVLCCVVLCWEGGYSDDTDADADADADANADTLKTTPRGAYSAAVIPSTFAMIAVLYSTLEFNTIHHPHVAIYLGLYILEYIHTYIYLIYSIYTEK